MVADTVCGPMRHLLWGRCGCLRGSCPYVLLVDDANHIPHKVCARFVHGLCMVCARYSPTKPCSNLAQALRKACPARGLSKLGHGLVGPMLGKPCARSGKPCSNLVQGLLCACLCMVCPGHAMCRACALLVPSMVCPMFGRGQALSKACARLALCMV